FEHYNPNSGKPSVFRGIDDYQHSWVVDLIIKYICGIRPEKDKIIIDPFPFEIDHFLIDRLYIRGEMICVERNKDKFKVNIDSKEHAERPIGESIEIII
ncbi:MAG: hypothetical protein GY863_09425, partial [bacterium]|nr:hypothetical protein [bacterium]